MRAGLGLSETRIFSMGVSKTFYLSAGFTLAALSLLGCAPEQRPVAATGAQSHPAAPALAKSVTPGATVSSPVSSLQADDTDAEKQSLIRSSEAAYASGVEHYRAGQLQAARSDFDRAVDLMLTSKFDLTSDPVMTAEFNRVVDAVNTLEIEALKQGNGFAPKIEPAPVDIANDVTFPVDPNIKAQAIAELKTTQSDLPLVINDPVASYINYFSSHGRTTLMRSLERAGRYREMISRVLREEGVPQDLIYQAVAESGFQPQIVNVHSGAGGMWQFMPSGPYGLARNGWFDERFDPEKSTVAYARYMKDLYSQLGDWYLAMAAYDWGPGNVQRAVQRTGYADFWELYRRGVLPVETRNYVPIIIAAAIMAKNPQQYGLQSLTPDPPILTDTVTTDYSVAMPLVSDLVGAPLDEILAINPSLLRMTTPAGTPFELHLPPGSKELYEKRIAEIPVDKRASWRFHQVAPGDTLASIGHDYRVSPAEIAFVNQIPESSDLTETSSLIVPVPPPPAIHGSARTRYRVQRGDTVVTIADRFNITVQQLRRWNRLGSRKLEPGRLLYVSEPAQVPRRAKKITPRHPSTAIVLPPDKQSSNSQKSSD